MMVPVKRAPMFRRGEGRGVCGDGNTRARVDGEAGSDCWDEDEAGVKVDSDLDE